MIIVPFNEDSLANALSNDYTSPEEIREKDHFAFFKRYLGENGLNAKTIVVEKKYISKDFLHDYADYYSLCFKDYSKYCTRVHFFGTSMDSNLLEQLVLGKLEDPRHLMDSYLGFIVVKPIPSKVIGYTVLKHYNQINNDPLRVYWGVRKYTIHIFGQEVAFDSLAFQEQDSVLAACATTAIWTMLNKASIDHHTVLKTPSQITKDAGHSFDGSRLFPNSGLVVEQICHAIEQSGLVCELKNDQPEGSIKKHVSNKFTKNILNAYSGLGIPIILVVEVPSERTADDQIITGLHAITVSGFHVPGINVKAFELDFNLNWAAESMDQIYAHDDQWGPFAKVRFLNYSELETDWSVALNSSSWVRDIIVPVYPKVRISYEDIERIVRGLDPIFKLFFSINKLKDALVWDIKVMPSEEYKKIVRDSGIPDEQKLKVLFASLPKYLWVIACCSGENKLLEISFDATDVNSGMIGETLVYYISEDLKKSLHEFLADKNNRRILKEKVPEVLPHYYYQFLLDNLQ